MTRWLDEVRDDVRLTLRLLARSPTFTLGSALTLALAIGGNGAIFALADATVLHPIPFADPHQLVMLSERTPAAARSVVAPFEFDLWRQRNRAFSGIAAVAPGNRAMRDVDGNAEQVPVQSVSTEFFDVLRVQPILGRTFLPEDDRPGADALVLAEPFWRSRFGGDRTIVGRRVQLDSQPFTVVGVVPAAAQVLTKSSVWTVMTTATMRSPAGVAHYLNVIGRLRSGQSMQTAQADMDGVAAAIGRERPALNADRGVTVEPLGDVLVGRDLRLTSLLLGGVVALVLLTGCANIANLLLARTAARAHEFLVRVALGAGRRRLVRQVLTESVVLASIGGVLGAALAFAILRMAPSMLPEGLLPVTVTLAPGVRVMAFCALATVAVAMACGIVPAWHTAGAALAPGMAGGRVTSSAGGRWRSLLAAAEIAAAMFLLCGAGLLSRSLLVLEHVDSGSRADDALTMSVGLPFARPGSNARYATAEERGRFFEGVEREVGQLATVRHVAWGSAMPLDGWQMSMGFDLAGTPSRPEAQKDSARYHAVSSPYFRTLEIPVLRGREFNERDTATGPPVCIVNEAFARRFLRGDPIGQRLVIRGLTSGGGPLPTREIVGVVRQVLEQPDELEAQPHVYVPLAQDAGWGATLVVRARTGRSEALLASVRAAIARVDPDRPVSRVRTLAGIGREATSRPRLRAVVVGAFAALALGIGVLGVFAVTAFSVEQRLPEFGVRMTFGATTANVIGIVAAGAARLTVVGMLAGLAGVALLSRWIGTFLFGIQPLDAATLIMSAVILLLVTIVAALTPAWRAANADPGILVRGR